MARWHAMLIATSFVACAELGVVPDGTTVSLGQSNRGMLLDARRLPDRGRGFVTRPMWIERGYRFGTDELIDLITGVAGRMSTKDNVRLVVADLSAKAGGGAGSRFHRSHQSGRDVDLLYFMRDANGRPLEADAMRVFDANGRATDGSGITVDIPRTWQLVKQLVTAPEAPVQFIFMYEPIAARLLERAAKLGESGIVIARARMALYQPGRRAPHDDHMHVRVYCSNADRRYGCVDSGPMELLIARNADALPTSAQKQLATATPAETTSGPWVCPVQTTDSSLGNDVTESSPIAALCSAFALTWQAAQSLPDLGSSESIAQARLPDNGGR